MRSRAWWARVLGGLCSVFVAGTAIAAEPAPVAPLDAAPPAKKTVRPEDARGYEVPPGTEPEDVALAAPRAVLAVPRYALKLVFWPIREGIEFADRHALVERVRDFLYNDARTAAIVPTFGIDSYFGPSFGAKAFHEDLAGHGEYASAEARFGGQYKLATQLNFRANNFGGSPLWLESATRYESEPGLLFQGIGHGDAPAGGERLDPRAGQVATRYSEDRYLGFLRSGVTFGRPGGMLQLGATGIYNVRDFGEKHRGRDPSIEQVYDTSRLVGFGERVATFETDLNVILDVRDVAGATASGFYLELFGGYVPRIGQYSFWHHGAELTGYIDLYKRTRVLVLRAFLEGVEGDEQDIPFAELPRLGGPNRLRGYKLDRFRDEKTAVGTVEYRYPIHQYVAGSLYLDVGRAERTYSDFFDSRWKTGFGGGFIVRSRDRQLFAFDIAYGDGVRFYLTTDPLRAFSKRDTEL
jgi:outer membrane protein assembly factor BamA